MSLDLAVSYTQAVVRDATAIEESTPMGDERPHLERHEFPFSRFPLPPPEAYDQAAAEISQTENGNLEMRDRLVHGVVSLARGSYHAFEEFLLGHAPESAESFESFAKRASQDMRLMDRPDKATVLP